MRRALTAAVLLLAAGTAAGCTYFRHDVEPYRPPVYYGPTPAQGAALVDTGRQLYQRDCAYCHGDDGKGTAQGVDITVGTNGGALTDFVLRTGRMPVDAPPEQMRPGKPVYNDNEIAAIVAYVTGQFRAPGPDVAHVDLARGDLGVGQQVYQEHCASCHATTGIGGAMLINPQGERGDARGIKIPDLEATGPQAVAEAVRTGPGSMPVFNERAISDEELESLVRYVHYLQDPRDEGGAPIGRVGPVVEGAVGWLVGLGALVLLIRWVGTKAGEVE